MRPLRMLFLASSRPLFVMWPFYALVPGLGELAAALPEWIAIAVEGSLASCVLSKDDWTVD